jgi:hypothetical protein
MESIYRVIDWIFIEFGAGEFYSSLATHSNFSENRTAVTHFM